MKVCFTVHGRNRAEIEQHAAETLGDFTQGAIDAVAYDVRPCVQNWAGEITMWVAEIEAEVATKPPEMML